MDDKSLQPNDTRNLQVPGRDQTPAVPVRHDHTGAANVARAQIDHIYNTDPPHQTDQSAQLNQQPTNPYIREHADASSYDWKQYHSAWQDYYQKYYQAYYTQYVRAAQQKLLEDHAKQPAAIAATVVGEGGNVKEETPTQKFRRELLEKVKTRAKKFQKSSHFMPIASALAVGLVFFLFQFNKVIAAQVNAYVSPSQTISDNVIIDPNSTVPVGQESRLVIPKINVDVPIVYGLTSLANDPTQKLLEQGVVHYPIPGANSLPGQTGNNVILGHSSNDVFKPGNYKFAFVLLERLQAGDSFYIHYKGTRYIYTIFKTETIEPNQVSKLVLPADKPTTTLVTCTPVGTDDHRFVVYANQVTPDPNAAEKIQQNGNTNEKVDIPGNEPSFLEKLFGR